MSEWQFDYVNTVFYRACRPLQMVEVDKFLDHVNAIEREVMRFIGSKGYATREDATDE